MTRTFALCLPFLLMATPSGPGQTAAGMGERLCETAAAEAAAIARVPLPILRAILVAQSGMPQRNDEPLPDPWPWSVSAGPERHIFEDAAGARSFALDRLRAGQDDIALGCFQIGWRWHGPAFGSVERMLDPGLNARYAADMLQSHYRQTGDWRRAAGAFHSADPALAEAYARQLEAIHAADPDPVAPRPQAAARGPLILPPGGPLIGADP